LTFPAFAKRAKIRGALPISAAGAFSSILLFRALRRMTSMPRDLCRLRIVALSVSLACGGWGLVEAQTRPIPSGARSSFAAQKGKRSETGSRPRGQSKRPTTLVFVELVTGNEGVGIRAQRWTQVFEKLDVTLTIRRGTPRDKVGVTETKSGGGAVREVHVVGKLDARGRLAFGDRTYTENDADKLAEWLDELREFGGQGTPEKQPVWGLTNQQFKGIHSQLSQPLGEEPKDHTLPEALKLFGFPRELPVQWTQSAEQLLEKREGAAVTQSLSGVSRGTALAALLSEQGLAFRPKRLPDGAIVLSIEPASALREAWPVGWTPVQTAPVLAPKLFSYTMINLDEIELDAVLDAAVDFIGMPILVDKAELASREIDFSKIKVSHPEKRTTWGLALRSLLAQAKSKHELLVDESGRPFLWVTSLNAPRRIKND
jgi:hypothetical protein